jgi:hypothetical protein
MPGGGTVAYVNPLEHRYLTEIEHREEGGTPAIVESIRAGLVFQLKMRVGVEAIRQREEAFIGRAIARWRANPAIEILGNPALDRLSIVSFVVRHQGRYLHHNFVVALLNDLFGIQSRGGCSCAGPYGHRLLGIDLDTSHEFEREIARGCEASSRAGSRQLQLFHQRYGLPLHPRRRRPRGQPRLAALRRYRFEPSAASGCTPTGSASHRSAWPTSTRPGRHATPRIATGSESRLADPRPGASDPGRGAGRSTCQRRMSIPSVALVLDASRGRRPHRWLGAGPRSASARAARLLDRSCRVRRRHPGRRPAVAASRRLASGSGGGHLRDGAP